MSNIEGPDQSRGKTEREQCLAEALLQRMERFERFLKTAPAVKAGDALAQHNVDFAKASIQKAQERLARGAVSAAGIEAEWLLVSELCYPGGPTSRVTAAKFNLRRTV